MKWFERLGVSVLCVLGLFWIGSALWQWYGNIPQHITDEPANGTLIDITLDRIAADSEGCFNASWSMSGIQTVTVRSLLGSPQGLVGEDTQCLCVTQDTFMIWTVTLPDESQHSYTFPVIQSLAPMRWVYGVLMLALSVLGVGVWIPRWTTGVMRWWSQHTDAMRWGRWDWLLAIGLILAVWLLYAPAKFTVYGGDYEPHLYYAYAIGTGETVIQTPHFLFHVLVIALAPLSGLDDIEGYRLAAHWLRMVAHMVTVVTLYGLLRWQWSNRSQVLQRVGIAGIALSLMLIWPIVLPTLANDNLFYGYLPAMNLFHNPTTTLLMPFALLVYGLVLRLAFADKPLSPWWTIGTAVMVFLSLFAKPSFIIVLLPPLGLWLLWVLIRERRIHWPIVWSVFAVSVPVLLWQFSATFGGGEIVSDVVYGPEVRNSQVIFAPLAVMLSREPRLWMIGVKFLLSIAFPLALLLRCPRQVIQDRILVFTWGMFFTGAFYAYFIGEAGERLVHGNFTWSGHLALWLLMIASLMRWQAWQNDDHRSDWLIGTVFALHVFSGIIWHAVNVTSGYGFFWW